MSDYQHKGFGASDSAFSAARLLLVGGVNSPVRAYRAVGGAPVFVTRGNGAYLEDVDGNRYVDFVGAYGPAILGHAHPAVVAAVREAVADGFAFGAPTTGETALAGMIREAFPTLEKVRLVNSGTEATMSAIRLARGYTGRAGIIKIAGNYHGHVDALLVTAGSGATTLGSPDSAGIPPEVTAHTHLVPHNSLEAVQALVDTHGSEIAALIVEPVAGNMGVVPPREGYLEGLRAITREHGIVLIFDEVMTGFRVSHGGAQSLYGIRPDLTCLGKVIGGGMPIGAYGGRAEIMAHVAPEGPVYQAGTLSGNPIAVACGRATLAELQHAGVYERLERVGETLVRQLREIIAASGHAAVVQRVGSMWTLFFSEHAVDNYDDAKRCDTTKFAKYFQGMLGRGVMLPPSQFEACFISAAHTDAAIAHTVAAARDTFAQL